MTTESAPRDSDNYDRDVETIRDAVNACRQAMIDLPLAHKTVVLGELERWVAAEEAKVARADSGFLVDSAAARAVSAGGLAAAMALLVWLRTLALRPS